MKLHKHLLLCLFFGALFSCSEDYDEPLTHTNSVEVNTITDLLSDEDKTYFTREELAEMESLRDQLNTSSKLLKSRNTIFISAGSNDKIQDAIDAVPDGGMVVLKSGTHYNSGTIHIHDKRVRLIGIGDVELTVDTEATTTKGYVQSAIHMKEADKSLVMNIDIKPKGDIGGTGIFIQNSDQTTICSSSITNYEFAILVEQSDRTRIYQNRIVGHPRWIASNLAEEVYGIMIVNGIKSIIVGNNISNTVFGSWLCDEDGRYFKNTTSGNFIGSILCNIPHYIPLKNGDVIGSDKPATNWLSLSNKSIDNLYTGYSITDGSNGNFLSGNVSSGNGAYDIEVMGDTNFFGFFTPTAKNNKVVLKRGQVIKDCAEDTSILNGSKGTVVDKSEDPCPE